MSEVINITDLAKKGYGIVYKAIMQNPDISIKAKGIYCYLASYCGRNSYAYPSRCKILFDLSIGTSAYYNHYNSLIERGILSVKSSVGNRNQYYIIKSDELKAQGYGIIYKTVMTDNSLDLSAKALYGYLCTYTSATKGAYPSKAVITYHLNISDGTYQKLIKQLINAGYVTVTQLKSCNGTYSTNNYIINDTTKPQEEITDTEAQCSVEENQIDVTELSEEPYTEEQHIKNQDNHIKVPVTNNTRLYNQSISKLISMELYASIDIDLEHEVIRQIEKNCGIAKEYIQSPELLVQTVKLLCNFEEHIDSYVDTYDKDFYCFIVSAIAELAVAGGKTISASHAVNLINSICLDSANDLEYGSYHLFEDFVIEFVRNYKHIISQPTVKYQNAYLKVCLENELKSYIFDCCAV